MVKNRVFALVYRLIATALSLIGLILGSGIVGGPVSFLSYTGQSNILCFIYFAYASVWSAIMLAKKGITGSACCNPRVASGILVTILFTMIIFWGVLAPFIGGQNLLSVGNLLLHTVTPLLMAGNHILFCEKGTLKKRDAWLFAIIPSLYVLESLTLGLLGVVFYVKDGVNYYAPYIFMDFFVIGWQAALAILLIAAAFVGASLLLIFFNNKTKT